MKDGSKTYTRHRKGSREIITVSLPLNLVVLLEGYANRRKISRSEAISMAVYEFFSSKIRGVENVEG